MLWFILEILVSSLLACITLGCTLADVTKAIYEKFEHNGIGKKHLMPISVKRFKFLFFIFIKCIQFTISRVII